MKCFWFESICLFLKFNFNVYFFVYEFFYLCCLGEVKFGSVVLVSFYFGYVGDFGVRVLI